MGLSAQHIGTLPSTLRFLHTSIDSESLSEDTVLSWPPQLECLDLRHLKIEHLSKMLPLLPKDINTLEMSFILGYRQFASRFDPQAAAKLDASLLPKELTSLNIASGITQINGRFPSTLNNLNLSRLETLTIPIEISVYPDSLQRYHTFQNDKCELIPLPHTLTLLEVFFWPYEFFDSIPKSVTILKIEGLQHNTNDTRNCFSSLPVALESLKIHTFLPPWPQSIIDGFDFSSLVNLKTLHILPPINASKAFPTLPRGLLSFYGTSSATAEDAAHLPRRLRHILGIRWKEYSPQLTENCPLPAIGSLPEANYHEEILRARLRSFM